MVFHGYKKTHFVDLTAFDSRFSRVKANLPRTLRIRIDVLHQVFEEILVLVLKLIRKGDVKRL